MASQTLISQAEKMYKSELDTTDYAKLLTQPAVDVMKGNLEKQQDAIMAAVNSLLNTKMDKSQTVKYAYDESRLPYEMEGTWKDVNILDVIKKLGK